MSAGVLALALALNSGCSNQEATAAAQKTPPGAARAASAVPVKIGVVSQRAMPVQVRAIGNVQPYSTVQVKSEVGGELTRVHFTEGQDVRKGDLLFTIDPRPFQAALQQAEANLARDKAQAQNAEADVRRYEDLFKGGLVAAQQFDQLRTNAAALQANVRADQAAIETARLQLSYTTIRSPIDGRTGNLLVHQGNLVKANDVPLVVINRIQPIYVSFSVPAQNLPEIKRNMGVRPLRVEARPQNGAPPSAGELTFIDNTVDVTTGTIMLKGLFPNGNRSLWPGQFVDAILTLRTEPNAVVAPSAAIQTGQQGQYVFVVKRDMTVESRPVVVNRTVNNLAVIDKGLVPGEWVVTDGQLRLVPGAKVSIAGGGT